MMKKPWVKAFINRQAAVVKCKTWSTYLFMLNSDVGIMMDVDWEPHSSIFQGKPTSGVTEIQECVWLLLVAHLYTFWDERMLLGGIKERNDRRPEYQQKTDKGSWRQNARNIVLKSREFYCISVTCHSLHWELSNRIMLPNQIYRCINWGSVTANGFPIADLFVFLSQQNIVYEVNPKEDWEFLWHTNIQYIQ
jgi:hypothetical protein